MGGEPVFDQYLVYRSAVIITENDINETNGRKWMFSLWQPILRNSISLSDKSLE